MKLVDGEANNNVEWAVDSVVKSLAGGEININEFAVLCAGLSQVARQQANRMEIKEDDSTTPSIENVRALSKELRDRVVQIAIATRFDKNSS